ncbi:DNA damage-inducible protein D [Patescibacteria group bacterium]
MEKEIIKSLTKDFESIANKTDDGLEFWLARDLQQLLGYSKWENFNKVILKARTACEISGHNPDDHFPGVRKMVEIGSGAQKEIDDVMLTRYACYLIAQNGDSKKEEIAFAQTYFAVQTRKLEIIEQRILESERVQSRRKLAETEKELSTVIFEQTGDDKNFAFIRSNGDKALFGKTTQQMKLTWNVRNNKPLADFMPTILLKAKDFATEITIFNAKEREMKTEGEISNEHITNNKTVRETLKSRGIVPENLPPERDVKKVERRIKAEDKKMTKGLKEKAV